MASTRSTTSLPRRVVANRTSSTSSRGRRLVGDEGVGGVDAELGLAGARRRPAAQPGELLAQQVVAALGGHLRHPLALGLGEHVCRVAALEGVDRPVHDLPRVGGDGVEEPPVVGDGDDGVVGAGAVTHEVVGQPGDPLDVEVVGRLVEQQHGRVRDEQSRQREPAALATGHRADRRVEPPDACASMPPSRPVEHVADARVTGPHVLGAGRRARPRDRVPRGRARPPGRARPTLEAAGAGHPAGVDLPRPARTRSSVVLPPPLRPTTPMRSPPSDAEGDLVEHLGGAEGEGGALDADEVGHQSSRGALGRRVGTVRRAGPWRGGRRWHRARRRERHGQVERGLVVLDEERDRRARAGHDAAEGAELQPGVEHLAELAAQGDGGRLQVVGAAPGPALAGRRSAARIISAASATGSGTSAVAAQPVALGIHGRGRQAALG